MAVSFAVLKVPQVSSLKIGGRGLWLIAVTQGPNEGSKISIEKVV